MKNVPFQCALVSSLQQVFLNLSLEVKSMTEQEKVCCLTLDEISLTSLQYGVKQGNFVGIVTLPNHSENVNHALAFILGGLLPVGNKVWLFISQAILQMRQF
ncbi:hypothetical protein HOLleu_16464 [Holothuria leucospilota]|uniref:Transposable element P transposase-like RNase H domain-containing protein n=1 Tax=Holothuria leucospilota TaxID=206669 RepID=A0A9Q1C680_HOLLE|nr:hypothetical protein HOLleu_16464 [Holothuria leucospilota]